MTEAMFQRSSTVLWRDCSRSVLLLPRGASRLLELTGSGVELWHLLETPHTLSATVNSLAERFDVDADQVETSIGPVLQHLWDAEALEPLSR